ncbi:UDP-glucose:sterol glucosyltransferase, partial [Phakopsora pachyrhizi]
QFWVWLDNLLVLSYKTYKGANLLFESPSTMSGIPITEVTEILYFRAFTMPLTQTREYPHVFAVPNNNMGSRYNYMT